MRTLKYVFSETPKIFKWLIPTVFVAPPLIQVGLKFLVDEPSNFIFQNILIFISIALGISVLGLLWGSLRSVHKLLNENSKITPSSEESTTELISLPYSKVKIGQLTNEYLTVDILAKIVLLENTRPDISLFLERIQINQPFCYHCSRPLEAIRDGMLDGAQVGYRCRICRRDTKGNYQSVLRDVKAEVRKNYEAYWETYNKEILQITNSEPEKYTVPT